MTSDRQPPTRTRGPTIHGLVYGFVRPGVQESWNPRAFGCGKAKQDRRVTAGAMYVGTFHGSCRETAKALLQDGGRQYILSAAHGLLDLSTEIDPYDITVGDPGSVNADFVQAQVRERGIESAEVTVLAGSKYVALARQSWPDLKAPLAGASGIGEMKQRLSQIRLAARAEAGQQR